MASGMAKIMKEFSVLQWFFDDRNAIRSRCKSTKVRNIIIHLKSCLQRDSRYYLG